MLLNKSFLAELFNSNHLSAPTIIASGTSIQINLVVVILHNIAVGNIPISEKSLKELGSTASYLNR